MFHHYTLPEQILTYCLLDPVEQTTMKYLVHIKKIISQRYVWKLRIFCRDLTVFKKHVSWKAISNYIRQYLWDVITCPCPWYLLLAHNSSYDNRWESISIDGIKYCRAALLRVVSLWFDVAMGISALHMLWGKDDNNTVIEQCVLDHNIIGTATYYLLKVSIRQHYSVENFKTFICFSI